MNRIPSLIHKLLVWCLGYVPGVCWKLLRDVEHITNGVSVLGNFRTCEENSISFTSRKSKFSRYFQKPACFPKSEKPSLSTLNGELLLTGSHKHKRRLHTAVMSFNSSERRFQKQSGPIAQSSAIRLRKHKSYQPNIFFLSNSCGNTMSPTHNTNYHDHLSSSYSVPVLSISL